MYPDDAVPLLDGWDRKCNAEAQRTGIRYQRPRVRSRRRSNDELYQNYIAERGRSPPERAKRKRPKGIPSPFGDDPVDEEAEPSAAGSAEQAGPSAAGSAEQESETLRARREEQDAAHRRAAANAKKYFCPYKSCTNQGTWLEIQAESRVKTCGVCLKKGEVVTDDANGNESAPVKYKEDNGDVSPPTTQQEPDAAEQDGAGEDKDSGLSLIHI